MSSSCAGYGALQVLAELSFTAGAEAVTIVGRNEMDKSLPRNTLMGLVRPMSGPIAFRGQPIDNLPRRGSPPRHYLI